MNKRIIYVDLLRVMATFSVIFLHVAAGNWANVNLGTYEWKVFNFYDSIVRFGVPIFVMISGMFLLNPNKEISYKDIYFKYILRIIISLASWSFLYAIYTNLIYYDQFNKNVFVKSFLFGHYHMWYLYMLIGLYIFTPLLRKIAPDKKATEYFLLFSFIITFVLPITIKIFNLTDFEIFIDKFDLNFTFGYVGYYVAGYYFSSHEIKKHHRNIIYIFGVIGLISTYLLTDLISLKTGNQDSTFYSYFSPNVMIVSLSIFIFFKYEVSKVQFNKNANTVKIIITLSDYSFRIYLVHDFLNIILLNLGFITLNYNPLYSVPIVSIIVFAGSFIISYIISKTPLLNRVL